LAKQKKKTKEGGKKLFQLIVFLKRGVYWTQFSINLILKDVIEIKKNIIRKKSKWEKNIMLNSMALKKRLN